VALGDAYATAAELEERTGRTDDGSFTALVGAASRAVESFTGRQFNKTTTATARRFRPLDPARLPVDDFHTVTDLAVSVDGAVWDVDTVDPRPWDGVVNGQTGWPFFDLFTVNRSWPSFRRRAIVTVTAQWGWAAVPEGIKQATLDVASVMAFGGAAGGPVRSEAIDGYSVSYATPTLGSDGKGVSVPAEMVKAVAYKRVRFGVA
jgi:hypothetical protein